MKFLYNNNIIFFLRPLLVVVIFIMCVEVPDKPNNLVLFLYLNVNGGLRSILRHLCIKVYFTDINSYVDIIVFI